MEHGGFWDHRRSRTVGCFTPAMGAEGSSHRRVLPRGDCRLPTAVTEVGARPQEERPGSETARHSSVRLGPPPSSGCPRGPGGVAQHVTSLPAVTVSNAWRAGSRATPACPWGFPCLAGSCSCVCGCCQACAGTEGNAGVLQARALAGAQGRS